jgi:plastocyanin
MRTITWVLACVAAVGGGAGCGGDGDGGVATGKPAPQQSTLSSVIELTPLESDTKPLRFDARRLKAEAGLVEIRLENTGTRVHNVRIQKGATCCDPANDVGGTDTVGGGEKAVARVKLEPGTYWFLCSVASHWKGERGQMKGPLEVL